MSYDTDKTKREIVRGFVDKPGLRNLVDIANSVSKDTTVEGFAQSVQDLNDRGVLPIKQTPLGHYFDLHPDIARKEGYL